MGFTCYILNNYHKDYISFGKIKIVKFFENINMKNKNQKSKTSILSKNFGFCSWQYWILPKTKYFI